MPRYEYKCKQCNKSFEARHGIHENVEKCESCGGPVRRVFHPVGIVFKGSGFYATDSKKPGYTTKTTSEDTSGDSEKKAEAAASKDAKSKQDNDKGKNKGGKPSDNTAKKVS